MSAGPAELGLWCNWIFVALTVVGWPGIAHFAPAREDLGLDATKVWFGDTPTQANRPSR